MKTNITLIVILLAFSGAFAHAQSEAPPRVSAQEKAVGAQVQINQIDSSQFPNRRPVFISRK